MISDASAEAVQGLDGYRAQFVVAEQARELSAGKLNAGAVSETVDLFPAIQRGRSIIAKVIPLGVHMSSQ
jgi:hypothetical protein